MKIKFIKLINNERVNKKLTASKACDATSDDYCVNEDNADCTVYAYDFCGKDYAACYEGANDECEMRDHTVCYGPQGDDTETVPYR